MKDFLGDNIKLVLFGESHGPFVGATLLGLPAGIKINHIAIKQNLSKRRPNSVDSTSRIEQDEYTFISGVSNDFTNGNPLTVIIKNEDIDDSPYSERLARPSHSDFTNYLKNGDYGEIKGGGFSSGRLTASLMIIEAILNPFLKRKNITIDTWTLNIEENVKKVKESRDSLGAKVMIKIQGVEGGLGGPYFSSLESKFACALLSIPGVKGIEFGLGFAFENKLGSEVNDQFMIKEGKICTKTNNCGGINGGISNGNEITFDVIFKPTSSIGKSQDYLNLKNKTIVRKKLTGRYDPCIAVRGKYVVKALLTFVILDELMNKYGTELYK